MRLLIVLATGLWLTLLAAGALPAVAQPSVTVENTEVAVPSAEAPVVTTEGDTTTVTTPDAVTTVSAPEATTVVVPYGNWVDAFLENLLSIVGSAVALVFAWLARKLPKAVVDILITLRAEQLLTRAAEYGINATRGAVKDKALSIDVGNEAIAKAANYAIHNGPGWLIDWLGGATAIRDKIIARIPLDESFGAK